MPKKERGKLASKCAYKFRVSSFFSFQPLLLNRHLCIPKDKKHAHNEKRKEKLYTCRSSPDPHSCIWSSRSHPHGTKVIYLQKIPLLFPLFQHQSKYTIFPYLPVLDCSTKTKINFVDI